MSLGRTRDIQRRFRSLKALADDAIAQAESDFFTVLGSEDNSVAVIVKHVSGNMRSRWRDFLTSDGEKAERDRDLEFVIQESKEVLLETWERGWATLFGALEGLESQHLLQHLTFLNIRIPARQDTFCVPTDIPRGRVGTPRAYNKAMSTKSIADLRQNYTMKRLEPRDLNPDPIEQFRIWLDEAIEAKLLEPNAMTLATVNRRGQPSARVVLLKGLDERGFVFYSNYESHKAQNMAENSNVALVFNWLGLERQVRIRGEVSKVSHEESLAYFKSRPHASQLGAWASHQSRVIEGREVLEERLAELQEEYEDGDVPLPEFWGGYVVRPVTVEFWQGRPSRLHDRFLYTLDGERWRIERLSP